MKALTTVRYEMSTDLLVYPACNFYFFVEGMWIQRQEEIFFCIATHNSLHTSD